VQQDPPSPAHRNLHSWLRSRQTAPNNWEGTDAHLDHWPLDSRRDRAGRGNSRGRSRHRLRRRRQEVVGQTHRTAFAVEATAESKKKLKLTFPSTVEAGLVAITLKNSDTKPRSVAIVRIVGDHTVDGVLKIVNSAEDGGPIPPFIEDGGAPAPSHRARRRRRPRTSPPASTPSGTTRAAMMATVPATANSAPRASSR